MFRPTIKKQQSEPLAEAIEYDNEEEIHSDLRYIDRGLLKASQNKLDTLKGNNYHTWAFVYKLFLKERDL